MRCCGRSACGGKNPEDRSWISEFPGSGRWSRLSSKGLGRGCAEALALAGVDLVLNARGAEALEATAEALRIHGVSVTTAAGDIVSADGRARVLDAAGEVDILVTNAGGPPPGLWTDWDREDFIAALDANMLTPIALMQALLPGMMDRGWGRVVNITSQSVKSPIPALGLSNSSRAGLTGYVAGTARQVAPSGVTINNLLPGIHETARAASLDRRVADREGISSNRRARTAKRPFRRAVTAPPPSSAPLAPFSVRSTPDTSSDRTSFWTAAPSTRRSEPWRAVPTARVAAPAFPSQISCSTPTRSRSLVANMRCCPVSTWIFSWRRSAQA